MESDDCDVNAHCNNTEGSFQCTCNNGFTGSGTLCSKLLPGKSLKSLTLQLLYIPFKVVLKVMQCYSVELVVEKEELRSATTIHLEQFVMTFGIFWIQE